MLPNKEEQLNKWDRICNTEGLSHYDRAQEYAKWYAEEVIKHCAEVAKVEQHNPDCIFTSRIIRDTDSGYDYYPDKQSILNVINEL